MIRLTGRQRRAIVDLETTAPVPMAQKAMDDPAIVILYVRGKRVTARADRTGRPQIIWRMEWEDGHYGETTDLQTLADWGTED